MFQDFTEQTRPEQGLPRLAALRAEIAAEGLSGFVVPRADAHQGERVAPRDERLAWLTGFSGSAGYACVLSDVAGIFVDGRYRIQARTQTAPDFSQEDWTETRLSGWLKESLPAGGRIGFDPWLHTAGWLESLEKELSGTEIRLVASENLVDRIWTDRPPRPSGPVSAYPAELAGKGDETKRAEICAILAAAGQVACVLTLPDSICWLLNIRGSDLPRIPVVQAFAILRSDGRMELFSDPAKFDALGPDNAIELLHWDAFESALERLSGPVRVDKASAPLAISRTLEAAGIEISWGEDPCILPKAQKTAAEISATTEAHLRDGAAMVEFLAWLDGEARKLAEDPARTLTEIGVAKALEKCRRDTNALRDIAFDSIVGSGPNGAVVHYRVTENSDRAIAPGELLLVDSGGQYLDGTTDITRTVAIGEPDEEHRLCFTRVLRGMIAVSRLRWPKGLAGRDLDAIARYPLWLAGQDYDHGTGHGVGVYLDVHEALQRLSRMSDVPLRPGMILSNEPGYYREGEFGIRIENLVAVEVAPVPPGGDEREMYRFATLTWAPIDRRLIVAEMLSGEEIEWLNGYHDEVLEKIGPRVGGDTLEWLRRATEPIGFHRAAGEAQR